MWSQVECVVLVMSGLSFVTPEFIGFFSDGNEAMHGRYEVEKRISVNLVGSNMPIHSRWLENSECYQEK